MKWKLVWLIIIFSLGIKVYADTQEDLQSKIDERNQQIKQLEQEISQYNSEVTNASNQARTLQNTLKTLNLTQRKIGADISLTQNKITKANLTIDQLSGQIEDTKAHIDLNKKAIASAIKYDQSIEDIGIVGIILSKSNIGDIWNDLDSTHEIQSTIRNKSKELSLLQSNIENQQSAVTDQKNNLVRLQKDLGGKREAIQETVKEQNSLLVQTKNKEQTFKDLVQQKEIQKAQFEKDVFNFESQLHLQIDKTSYPAPQHGILSWPLDNVFITQGFGKTVGAEKLYVSGSHNGVDFRASIGTAVKNVLAGTIVGTGNTDAYPGCYSFGKWVMVKHDNGLSTIYGHLSAISVSNGDHIQTGDLIGYTGNTGYTTGPHLHISVYATQGVRIEKFVNSRGCKEAILPLADTAAYLDPLAYFPSL